MALSRLLYAAGREGEMPRALQGVNAHGAPDRAIWAVIAVSVLIPFLGRTAIGWIVDVTTLGATIIYGLISHAVFRHARKEKRSLETLTGRGGITETFREIRREEGAAAREEDRQKDLARQAAEAEKRHHGLYQRFIAGQAGLAVRIDDVGLAGNRERGE